MVAPLTLSIIARSIPLAPSEGAPASNTGEAAACVTDKKEVRDAELKFLLQANVNINSQTATAIVWKGLLFIQ